MDWWKYSPDGQYSSLSNVKFGVLQPAMPIRPPWVQNKFSEFVGSKICGMVFGVIPYNYSTNTTTDPCFVHNANSKDYTWNIYSRETGQASWVVLTMATNLFVVLGIMCVVCYLFVLVWSVIKLYVPVIVAPPVVADGRLTSSVTWSEGRPFLRVNVQGQFYLVTIPDVLGLPYYYYTNSVAGKKVVNTGMVKESVMTGSRFVPVPWHKGIVQIYSGDKLVGMGSVVRIKRKSILFSSTEQLLLTATHVWEHNDLSLVGPGNKMVSLKDLACKEVLDSPSDQYDFTFVRVPPSVWAVLGVKALDMGMEDTLGSKSAVELYGPDELGTFCRTNGSMTEAARPWIMEHTASTRPGWSGTPILSGGLVVGVHCEGSATEGKPNQGVHVISAVWEYIECASTKETPPREKRDLARLVTYTDVLRSWYHDRHQKTDDAAEAYYFKYENAKTSRGAREKLWVHPGPLGKTGKSLSFAVSKASKATPAMLAVLDIEVGLGNITDTQAESIANTVSGAVKKGTSRVAALEQMEDLLVSEATKLMRSKYTPEVTEDDKHVGKPQKLDWNDSSEQEEKEFNTDPKVAHEITLQKARIADLTSQLAEQGELLRKQGLLPERSKKPGKTDDKKQSKAKPVKTDKPKPVPKPDQKTNVKESAPLDGVCSTAQGNEKAGVLNKAAPSPTSTCQLLTNGKKDEKASQADSKLPPAEKPRSSNPSLSNQQLLTATSGQLSKSQKRRRAILRSVSKSGSGQIEVEKRN